MQTGTIPPSVGSRGKLYYNTKKQKILYNTGKGWVPIGSSKNKPNKTTPEERFDRAKDVMNI